ncbi:MAG: GNAT family N-acetyltransferase [Acidimicrobiia bacterium]
MTPRIRDAALADVAELRDVFRRSSLHNEGDRATLLDHPEVLEFDPVCVHEYHTRVAVDDGRVVAFVTTRQLPHDIIELDDLFVDPDWTRRGIAHELIRDAEAIAHSAGARRIEVTANNHALAFYERVGFVPDGVAQTRFGPATRMHLDV